MTIRRQPADFAVEEVAEPAFVAGLARGWSDRTPQAVFELTKRSLTTPEAISRLGKALGIKSTTIDYAGLKDKHAVTVQMASVQVTGAGASKLIETREWAGPGWSARLLGFAAVALSAVAIVGNRFTIVVRDLARETAAEMDRRAGLLRDDSSRDGSLLVVNYFGAQRFGSARHGKGFAAAHLVRGEFEAALRLLIGTPARKDAGTTRVFSRMLAPEWGKWPDLARELPRCPERKAVELLAERAKGGARVREEDFRDAFAALPYFQQTMCVEAFQSHLWNATARRLAMVMCATAGAGGAAAGGEKPLRSDDQFGEMVFVPARAVAEPWRGAIVPLLGPETELREPWGGAAREALDETGIGIADLRITGLRRPFFGEAPRALVVRAAGFSLLPPERDEMDGGGKRLKRTVRFELPRGAYATVVLRSLGQ